MRAAFVVGACAALLSAAPPGLAAQPSPTFVGVVGSDGALTPIAVFDGHDWWNAWPWGREDVPALQLPSSLDAIPADWLPPGLRVPRDWRVLRRSGGTARLRALRPVRATLDGMMETFSIATTFRPDAEGEALAIAGPGVLGTFVTPGRDETERLLRQLANRLQTLERDEIERWRLEQKASGTEAASPLVRVYMMSGPAGRKYVTERPAGHSSDYGLTKASDRIQGRTYYYLHGEKLFRIKPGDECKMNLSSKGLVIVDGSGTVLSENLSSWAYAEYCGGAPEGSIPLGTVRIGSRTMWVVRAAMEDGFDYTLFDPILRDTVEPKGTWGTRGSR